MPFPKLPAAPEVRAWKPNAMQGKGQGAPSHKALNSQTPPSDTLLLGDVQARQNLPLRCKGFLFASLAVALRSAAKDRLHPRCQFDLRFMAQAPKSSAAREILRENRSRNSVYFHHKDLFQYFNINHAALYGDNKFVGRNCLCSPRQWSNSICLVLNVRSRN